jgi:hypothetical protein
VTIGKYLASESGSEGQATYSGGKPMSERGRERGPRTRAQRLAELAALHRAGVLSDEELLAASSRLFGEEVPPSPGGDVEARQPRPGVESPSGGSSADYRPAGGIGILKWRWLALSTAALSALVLAVALRTHWSLLHAAPSSSSTATPSAVMPSAPPTHSFTPAAGAEPSPTLTFSGGSQDADALPEETDSTTYAVDCYELRVRPESITLTCADAGIFMDHLQWRRWGSTKAVGVGNYHENDCEPSCAYGTVREWKVTVTLAGRLWCPNERAYVFRRMTLDFGSARNSEQWEPLECPLR